MLITNVCPRCKNPSYVEVPPDVYERWQKGMMLQYAWPASTPTERETLITGYHDACFDADFGFYEEDEEED